MSDIQRSESRISGSRVVIAMFALGLTATSILWTYWNLHLMPYMPLQEALAEEFDESSPRVDGGRRKMHKGTPMILRVVMRVPFDPTQTDQQTQELIDERIQTTRELATTRTTFEDFDILEVHLYKEAKEDELRQKTFRKQLKELL